MELLVRCRLAGLKLGVCTNKLERLSRKLIEAMGVEFYFGAIVGSDTLGIFKPDARPYRETLRQLGVNGGDSIFIGDSETDVLTARAAGVPMIGVTFGYADKADRRTRARLSRRPLRRGVADDRARRSILDSRRTADFNSRRPVK